MGGYTRMSMQVGRERIESPSGDWGLSRFTRGENLGSPLFLCPSNILDIRRKQGSGLACPTLFPGGIS